MLSVLIPVAHHYATGDRIIDRCIGDFTQADWRIQDPAGHDARWITGHLTITRRRLVAMMGLPALSNEWDAAFQRGSLPANVPEELSVTQILSAFHEAHQLMTSRWDAITEADLAKPLGRTLPDGSDTIGGAICFLAWHETYHLGQLGLLRRLAGKPGIA